MIFYKFDAFVFAFAIADASELNVEFFVLGKRFIFEDIERAECIDISFFFHEAPDLNEFSGLWVFQLRFWDCVEFRYAYAEPPGEDFFFRRADIDEHVVKFVACGEEAVDSAEHPFGEQGVPPVARVIFSEIPEERDIKSVKSRDDREMEALGIRERVKASGAEMASEQVVIAILNLVRPGWGVQEALAEKFFCRLVVKRKHAVIGEAVFIDPVKRVYVYIVSLVGSDFVPDEGLGIGAELCAEQGDFGICHRNLGDKNKGVDKPRGGNLLNRGNGDKREQGRFNCAWYLR